ncbi:MAG TPA: hypothetical protein DCY57_01950 [Bacteroidetes bacterium]|nr:hypothetical protein [Bacteroidota bacterium]
MKFYKQTYLPSSDFLQESDDLSDSQREELMSLWADLPSLNYAGDNGKARVRSVIISSVTPERSLIVDRVPMARIFDLRFNLVNIAAAVIVALGFILSPSTQQFRAIPGQLVTEVSLEDGSTVSLAPGSRLSVVEGFAARHRTVKLHGEAILDVEAGAVPFIVKTFDAETTVLGTQFNVKAWPGSIDAATQVSVSSGRVSVSVEDQVALVQPGQVAEASKEALEVVNADVSNLFSWANGGFHFMSEPISNVLDEIERRFDVRISAPASILHRPLSYSKSDVSSASEVLGDVAATISVRYRPTANGFELYLK